MKVKYLIALLGLVSGLAMAAEHPMGTIKGTNIDLKTYDHAMAGSIKDALVWGFVNEATFTSNLTMRKDEQIIEATFTRADGKVGGKIEHKVADKSIVTTIYLVKIIKETNEMVLSINDQEVKVAIQGAYENDHFVNPTYSAVINGETVSFQMQGEACFGYSFHLSALIFGAYVHQ